MSLTPKVDGTLASHRHMFTATSPVRQHPDLDCGSSTGRTYLHAPKRASPMPVSQKVQRSAPTTTRTSALVTTRPQPAMLRPRLRSPRLAFGFGLRATANARRSLHRVPQLQHDYSEGVPNLMSPGGFQIAWTDYMKLMVEKLNALTVGMLVLESLGVKQLEILEGLKVHLLLP